MLVKDEPKEEAEDVTKEKKAPKAKKAASTEPKKKATPKAKKIKNRKTLKYGILPPSQPSPKAKE